MTMRCALAALAIAGAPATADAIAIDVRNCSGGTVEISAIRPDELIASTTRTTPSGSTANLFCPWEECRIEITYYTPIAVTARFGTFRDARCTRGIIDRDAGTLAPVGDCGC